jgi:hypothetical protein
MLLAIDNGRDTTRVSMRIPNLIGVDTFLSTCCFGAPDPSVSIASDAGVSTELAN